MDVYLVPVGRDRYELYCEVPDDPEEVEAADPGQTARGFVRRLRDRFREMIAEAERERHQPEAAESDTGFTARMKKRTLRWVAESLAEQRLLWHLRKESEARLHYPDDLDEATAMGLLRSQLARDFEKHRFWLILDVLGFIASGLLMLVPGPNLLAYYFAFRLVGHYLSMRGARQGLSFITWHGEPCRLLTELRSAMTLEPELRVRSVRDIASQLRLENLATFFERTA
jgi:K+-H+ exchange-related protein